MNDLIPDATSRLPSVTTLSPEAASEGPGHAQNGEGNGLQNNSNEGINHPPNGNVGVGNVVPAKKAKGKRRNQIFERDLELDEEELELDEIEEFEDEEPEGSDEGSDARGEDSQPTLGDKQRAISKTSLLNRMCRVCGQETQTNRKVHFFTQTGVSNDYKNRLVTAMRFLNNDPQFDLSQSDTSPHFFCRKCHTRLLSFERAAQNLRVVYAKGLKVFKTVENGTHPSQLKLKTQQQGTIPNDAFQLNATAAASGHTGNGGAFYPVVKNEASSFEILARASQTFHQPTVVSTPPQQHSSFTPRPNGSTSPFVPYPQMLPYPGYLSQQQQQQLQQQQLQQQQMHQQLQHQMHQQQLSTPNLSGKRPVSQVDSPTADSESKILAGQNHSGGNLGSIGTILNMTAQPMFGVQQYGYPFHVAGESYPAMLPTPSPFSPMNFPQAYGFLPSTYFAPPEPQAQVRSLGALLPQSQPQPQQQQQQQQQSPQGLPQLPVPMRGLSGGGEVAPVNHSSESSDPPKRS